MKNLELFPAFNLLFIYVYRLQISNLYPLIMYVCMTIWYVRRITLTCNTAASVPRAACSSLRPPVQQWKDMRTVPSRRENKNVPPVPSKQKSTVPSRRGRNYMPSRPVVKNHMHRPVPSSKTYIPSRPVVTIFIYRPVPSWNNKVMELYRPVSSRKSHPPSRPVLSRQQYFSSF